MHFPFCNTYFLFDLPSVTYHCVGDLLFFLFTICYFSHILRCEYCGFLCCQKMFALSLPLTSLTSWEQIHLEESPGDILLFLTGQEEIESMERLLRERAAHLPPRALKLSVAPIYAALPSEQQMRVFQAAPVGTRKVFGRPLKLDLLELELTYTCRRKGKSKLEDARRNNHPKEVICPWYIHYLYKSYIYWRCLCDRG